MTDEDLLRRALALAAEHAADGRHGPFGALVVLGGEVVGEGWNQVVAGTDPTAHAEMVAIREACRHLDTHDLTGATIYCSCEPCPMCLSAIYWAHIERVVFAATAQDAEEAGFADAHILEEMGKGWRERRVEGIQVLPEEGREVLAKWFHNPAKVSY